MFVDQSGTKLVFVDDKSDGYIYSPVRKFVNFDFSPFGHPWKGDQECMDI